MHNARTTGQVELSRGRRSETVRVKELAVEEAVPVLKAYVERVPITRPYFDVAPDAPLAAFAAEAPQHPVFQVVPETIRPPDLPQRVGAANPSHPLR